MSKICTRCNLEKDFSLFSKGSGKFGLETRCKVCKKELLAEWKLKNPEKQKEYQKTIKDKRKNNPEIRKQEYQKNKEKLKAYTKAWRENNKERRNESIRNRRKIDEKFALHDRISCSIRNRLKGKSLRKSFDLLDYSVEDLKEHLEAKFLSRMSWNNMSEWHIDHIVPVSYFNFKSVDDKDFKLCWSINNLQPLWAQDNLNKNSKWNEYDYYTLLALEEARKQN